MKYYCKDLSGSFLNLLPCPPTTSKLIHNHVTLRSRLSGIKKKRDCLTPEPAYHNMEIPKKSISYVTHHGYCSSAFLQQFVMKQRLLN